MKGHVDSIAAKYIRPGGGDLRLRLHVPARGGDLLRARLRQDAERFDYAHGKRVLPVSPTTLTAYLQVVVLGLKGLQIEQHAHEVMAYCSAAPSGLREVQRADFELVGTHLGRAQNKYGEAERRLGKFETKLEQATEWQAEHPADEHELPRAVDAA